MPSSKFQPALFGGLVLGVLSALPIISMGNLCCCLWILGGGALAAYLLQANQPTAISVADGAGVGLLAGAIGAGVWLVVSIPVNLVMGPLQSRMMERVLEGDLPEGVRPMLEAFGRGGMTAVSLIVGFFVMLLLCVFFSTIGGVIGAALFKKSSPGIPDVLPPDLPPSLP